MQLLLVAASAVLLAAECAQKPIPRVAPRSELPPRSYRMGFSVLPPRPDIPLALRSVDAWAQRADAAILQFDPPWAKLVAGEAPERDVLDDKLPLLRYYRSKGITSIVVMIDPQNGLARGRESDALRALGRSITDPAIQELYRRYVTAVDTILHPQYLGLAAETNLIRLAAPRPMYEALVRMTNAAAADARARRSSAKPYVSVQVDVAWGRLQKATRYAGIADDVRDFPFSEILGLSSYPYLAGFDEPERIPVEYYSRLARESGKRVMVVEGGWASTGVSAGPTRVTSSPALQARYIARQAELLDSAKAIGVFQLSFTDLDLAAFPRDLVAANPILPLFASLGLVDKDLRPKPALARWDSTFARPVLAPF